MEVVILVGIAGSGKTTWCKRHLPGHVRISLDDMGHDRRLEEKMTRDELEKNNSIAVDDTNLTRGIRQKHIAAAKRYGAGVRAVYFCIDIQKAQRQNVQREKMVPCSALYRQKKQLEVPVAEEGLDSVRVLRL